MMGKCQKCGRQGSAQFSCDPSGLYCSNFGACERRRLQAPPIPAELCGVGGCCYLKGHDGGHTWE